MPGKQGDERFALAEEWLCYLRLLVPAVGR